MKGLKKQSVILAEEVNFDVKEDIAVMEILKLQEENLSSLRNYRTSLTLFLRIHWQISIMKVNLSGI